MPLQSPCLRTLTLLSLLLLSCSSEGGSGSSGSASDQPTSARFQNCGDGTILDPVRGIQWETKAGEYSNNDENQKGCDSKATHTFSRPNCPDTRNVMNRYTYCDNTDTRTANCDACQRGFSLVRQPYCQVSEASELVSGSVFYDFLDVLNADQFAGHSNWRLPTADELASIMVGAGATSDQPQTCVPGSPCIDGAFSGTATAEASAFYWTSDVGSLPELVPGGDRLFPCSNRAPCQTSGNFRIGANTPRQTQMNIPTYARAVRDFQPGDACGP